MVRMNDFWRGFCAAVSENYFNHRDDTELEDILSDKEFLIKELLENGCDEVKEALRTNYHKDSDLSEKKAPLLEDD